MQQLKDHILLEKETTLDRAILRQHDVIFDPARQTRPLERLKSEVSRGGVMPRTNTTGFSASCFLPLKEQAKHFVI